MKISALRALFCVSEVARCSGGGTVKKLDFKDNGRETRGAKIVIVQRHQATEFTTRKAGFN